MKNHLGRTIPYLDIGISVNEMTPQEFKKSYKGVYSHYFKFVKNHHNRYLGLKTFGELNKLLKQMSYYGVIYKISQFKDEKGNRLYNGGVLVVDYKKIQKGRVRVGRAIEIFHRLRSYLSYSHNPRNHFERALNLYGIKAFRIEIIAICKTKREFISTEYFWQLYYNRKVNAEGYDLDVNEFFNPNLGSRSDSINPYNIPKWELILFILKGLEKLEMRIIYGKRYGLDKIAPETLDTRFISYFGTRYFYKIKTSLIKPTLDKCFKRGFVKEVALKYLSRQGIKIFERSPDPGTLLTNYAINIYGDHGGKDKYRRIRQELFIKPYVEYLRSLGIKENLESPSMVRDSQTGRLLKRVEVDPTEWSIKEHLFVQNITPQEIAIHIGITSWNDDLVTRDQSRKMINDYLRNRWQYALKQRGIIFSFENLRLFLKTVKVGEKTYLNYLNIQLSQI